MHLAEGEAQESLTMIGTRMIDDVLVRKVDVQGTDLARSTGIHLLEAMEFFP